MLHRSFDYEDLGVHTMTQGRVAGPLRYAIWPFCDSFEDAAKPQGPDCFLPSMQVASFQITPAQLRW